MLLALRSLWESSVTTAFINAPGRVYPGAYPYWKKPKKKPKPDYEEIENEEEEDELAAFISMFMD